ncbi:histidine kinase [Nocardioides sp. 1609]|uniref:sensor histidine kinase n=1 Tax=Nocardioides sp. 1609 TaxID=2508327 RepID=UPI0010704B63|nr:histidine kinase [Nocardioides sp. 1609]
MSPQQSLRVALVARCFMLVVLGANVLLTSDDLFDRSDGLLALAALATIWATATLAEGRPELRQLSPVVEGAAVGIVCGVSVTPFTTILLALVLPPFVAALLGGPRIGALALVATLTAVVFGALTVVGPLTDTQSLAIFTWGLAGLGFGLIGAFVHVNARATPDLLAPYRDAQRLLRQLINLSDDLSSGLEVTTLAGTVLEEVGDAVPTESLVLYAPRGDVLVPLAARQHGVDSTDTESVSALAWTGRETVLRDRAFALPVGDSTVLGGVVPPGAAREPTELRRTLDALRGRLAPTAVQLDTAVLFADFRDAASADVRKRLAREMHDGVAQDIASLGYLVDALAAAPANEKQGRQLAVLRDRITAVVAEVRQSVLTLRTSIGEAESLGTAIGGVARHLSDASRIPIQVTLDEQAARLRPEVEAELFRIAQEAMNNAVKHARCTVIEVHCEVHAPDALITVSDDGRGLQPGRADSHGLEIMRERARLIGAELAIDNRPEGGLRVAVRVGPAR